MGNRVDAVKSKSSFNRVSKYFKSMSLTIFCIWLIGTYVGLRISDILSLNVSDVKNKLIITIKEKKTKKVKQFILNKKIRKFIKKLVKGRNDLEPLFLGVRGKRLNRRQFYRVLKQASEVLKLQIKIGTHTMRKTFGYFHYKQYKDVAILQKIFNHSSPSITLRYIGIEQDEINYSYLHFRI